jgi:LacI family transcriptional regulator/LacI family repressor for deo operon, udp, cdd, tsx, nupC, and nupG
MATIKDVAERAGVSTATVSYVLNGTGTVTTATRERVMAAVSELNYQPNHAARALRGRSRTLGLLMPALSARLAEPGMGDVLAGLTESAARHDYSLLLTSCADEDAEHLLAEQLLRTGRIDGVLIFDVRAGDERVAYLAAADLPFVCAGPPDNDEPVAYVCIDARQGAQDAVQHLLALGHRRIGLIMLPSHLTTSSWQHAGYVAALATAGLEFDPSLAVEAGASQDAGVTAMQELLDLPQPPSAVLAGSDDLAVGAMHALHSAGLQVGQEVSLVGCDDLPLASHTQPALTSLRAPRRDLGRQLAELLIATIANQQEAPAHIVLPMQLMIRATTGPCR